MAQKGVGEDPNLINWLLTMKNWSTRQTTRVKKLTRRGVPDCLRGNIWPLLAKARESFSLQPGLYEVSLSCFQTKCN